MSELFHVNPQVRLFLQHQPEQALVEVFLPHEQARYALHDWLLIDAFSYLTLPRSEEDFAAYMAKTHQWEASQTHSLLAEWQNQQVILSGETDASQHLWQAHQWDLAEVYHYASYAYSASPQKPELSLASAQVDAIALPSAQALPERSLWDVLKSRRTTPDLSALSISQQALANILYYGTHQERQADSHGCQLYIVSQRVEGLTSGIYRYAIAPHSLIHIAEGDFTANLVAGTWGQNVAKGAAFSLLLTADFAWHQKANPQENGYREMYFRLGGLAQRLIVTAVAYGFENSLTMALKDTPMNQLCQLDSRFEQVLYFLGFNQRRQG